MKRGMYVSRRPTSCRHPLTGSSLLVRERRIGDAQVLGDLGDRLAGALRQPDRLSSELVADEGRCEGGDLRWIDVFYNRQRLHTTLGNYAPEEFETISLNQLKEAA
jgi:hypothetical protein